ncbi:MAG: asparagine synthase-related protein [Actinomycetota bacterium]|nr:asparagine synthase-related protein [Actinomycetota bacterium]
MSAVAGILHRDGRPSNVPELAAMTTSMAHRGLDGTHHHTDGPIGIAHLLTRSASPAPEVPQPLVDVARGRAALLEGRIDNRRDLWARLGERPSRTAGRSDVELLQAAYSRWGTASLPMLIGDFVAVLWDAVAGELVIARDALGKRSLYYLEHADTLRWATEPQAVLADRSIRRTPNPGYAAELLAVNLRSTSETLFHGLMRLPPAHHLVARVGGRRLEVRRHWAPDAGPELRLATDADYAAHFHHVFTTAVSDRIAGASSVAVELSGGLDSSSVLAMAADLRDRGSSTALEAYSLVFPGAPWDESLEQDAVASRWGVHRRPFEPGVKGPEYYQTQIDRYLDLPDHPNQAMHAQHLQAIRADGHTVVLTGSGGDEWLTGSDFGLAEGLRRARPALVRQWWGHQRPAGLAGLVFGWGSGVRPLLPEPVDRRLRRPPSWTRPQWLPERFCIDVALADRLRPPTPAGPRYAADQIARLAEDGWTVHANELSERAAAAAGVDKRDPFDDRRLVELAVALPELQRRRGPYTKWVLRQAVDGLVPDVVRLRTDKAEFSYIFADELRAHGGAAAFDDLAIADLGWIDPSALRSAVTSVLAVPPGQPARGVWMPWLALAIERWVRATL